MNILFIKVPELSFDQNSPLSLSGFQSSPFTSLWENILTFDDIRSGSHPKVKRGLIYELK